MTKRVKHKNKKGFMRTLEVMIAIILALLFLAYIAPKQNQVREGKRFDLTFLEEDSDFRICAINQNYTCLNEIAQKRIPSAFNVAVNNSNLYYPDTKNDVFSDSFIISGDVGNASLTKIRIYYWKK